MTVTLILPLNHCCHPPGLPEAEAWHFSCAGCGVGVSVRMHVSVRMRVSARMRVGVSVRVNARMHVSMQMRVSVHA